MKGKFRSDTVVADVPPTLIPSTTAPPCPSDWHWHWLDTSINHFRE